MSCGWKKQQGRLRQMQEYKIFKVIIKCVNANSNYWHGGQKLNYGVKHGQYHTECH